MTSSPLSIREEREGLIDEALRIDPNEPNALSTKASFLVRKGQWKKAHHYLSTALNGYDDRLHKHPGFAQRWLVSPCSPSYWVRGMLNG